MRKAKLATFVVVLTIMVAAWGWAGQYKGIFDKGAPPVSLLNPATLPSGDIELLQMSSPFLSKAGHLIIIYEGAKGTSRYTEIYAYGNFGVRLVEVAWSTGPGTLLEYVDKQYIDEDRFSGILSLWNTKASSGTV